ncbi:MAG: hypothetical protein ACI837_001509 [Crocinitomicaceae bacterium]|jgi:hypothetical protein
MKIFKISLICIGFFTLVGCNKIGPDCEPVVQTSNCIDESQIDTIATCADIYDPVCGCNNVTYGNSCEANNAGITYYEEGPCCN